MTGFFEANLNALTRRDDPDAGILFRDLTARGPGPDLGLRDRTGKVLPGLVHAGRPRSLVSTFDPAKEADRWVSAASEAGTAAVFGAGGRLAAEALAARGTNLVFWIDPRPEVWQALFTWEDWTTRIADPGWIPVAGSPDEWEQRLLDRYHPLWDGSFLTLEWRAAVQGWEDLWESYRQGTLRAVDLLTSDTSTQARFGERWYRNTLVNLKSLVAAGVSGCPGSRVAVAGAGPGLDDALDDPAEQAWLRERPRTGDQLFSTDTAFPALTGRGILPDVVFCLDGQLPSYHHFVPEHPADLPLVADLAAIPFTGRVGMPVVRFLTGHPFGAVIRRYFPELPGLDGSLGNVSGLAWWTAWALGARQVAPWGVDFAYRNGQAYARGTYVYALAGAKAGRLTPSETLLSLPVYAARSPESTKDERGRSLVTTPILRSYRERWDRASQPQGTVRLTHGSAEGRWEPFVDHWVSRLKTIPFPRAGTDFHGFVRALPPDRRQDWLALWPLALALHRKGAAPLDLPQAVVDRALDFLPH